MNAPCKFKFYFSILLCLLVCTFLLASCGGANNPEKPLVQGQQTTGAKSSDSNQPLRAEKASSLSTMYMLYMKSGDFINLAAKRNGNGRKLMFQFCFSPKYGDTLTLRGWAGKDDQEYNDDGTKFILDTVKPDTDTYGREIYFSSQKIPKDDVNALLAEIGTSTTKFVVFDPEYNLSNSQIFYNVFVVSQLPKRADTEPLAPTVITTNPSPPASSKNNTRN